MCTTLASLMYFLYSLQANAIFPCPFEDATLPIGSQTILGFSGEEALSRILADSNPISLTWYYETPTTMPGVPMIANVSFKPSEDTMTVTRDLGGEDCYAMDTMLTIEGNLELQINDIGVNVHCPGAIVVMEGYAARLQTNAGGMGSSGEYCADLAKLPGALLSGERGAEFFIDIVNNQFNGEIIREYVAPMEDIDMPVIQHFVIASIGEGILGFEHLKPGYNVEGKLINR